MAFDLTDFMNEQSIKGIKQKELKKVVMLPIDKLYPTNENFYSKDADRVEKMAASILLLSTPDRIGIQQNLIVKPIPNSGGYEIIAGETRWRAVKLLLEEEKIEIDRVPCVVEDEGDPIRDELILIMTNSTQRERTDAEKMHEVERLRELLKEYRKNHKISGTTQSVIANMLGISKTKVGTLENINRNLSQELKQDYVDGKINTSVANKVAGLAREEQVRAKALLDEMGSIKVTDVAGLEEKNSAMESNKKDTGVMMELADLHESESVQKDYCMKRYGLSYEQVIMFIDKQVDIEKDRIRTATQESTGSYKIIIDALSNMKSHIISMYEDKCQ